MAKRLFLALLVVVSMTGYTFGQISSEEDQIGRGDYRGIISTAVPFLTIAPDARAAGMGDVGVATAPSANSSYWNPAKLPFVQSKDGELYDFGGSLSYTPWLRKLINDMAISYLTGYKRLRREEVVSFSMTYFDLGSMTFRDLNNNITGFHSPREFAFNLAYARMLTEDLSVSLGVKFIRSNLAGSISNNSGLNIKPGNTVAADLAVYYKKEDIMVGGMPFDFAAGANISNVGAKISYSSVSDPDFIPTNLKLGVSATTEIDQYNKVSFAVDINKLMVPSPPIYTAGSDDENDTIIAGKDPNRSFIPGMFGSFSDAPNGFKEELQEIMIGAGVEYWYANVLAVRGGYYHEHKLKGNRKYVTLGLGVSYNKFAFDFAYLIAVTQGNPLADTLRFSLLVNMHGKSKKEDSISEDGPQ